MMMLMMIMVTFVMIAMMMTHLPVEEVIGKEFGEAAGALDVQQRDAEPIGEDRIDEAERIGDCSEGRRWAVGGEGRWVPWRRRAHYVRRPLL